MNTNQQNNDHHSPQYTKEEMKNIYLHRAVLFCAAFLVFSQSAMTTIITLYPLVGYFVCIFLSGLISYFMSFTLYEYGKTKGPWVYGIVIVVALLMLMRYTE